MMNNMPHKNNHQETIAYRLTEGGKPEPHALMEEFGINLRTTQRDLSERFAFLELEKKNGVYKQAGLDTSHARRPGRCAQAPVVMVVDLRDGFSSVASNANAITSKPAKASVKSGVMRP